MMTHESLHNWGRSVNFKGLAGLQVKVGRKCGEMASVMADYCNRSEFQPIQHHTETKSDRILRSPHRLKSIGKQDMESQAWYPIV